MVERSLSMREVPGSIPGASKPFSLTGPSLEQVPRVPEHLLSFGA